MPFWCAEAFLAANYGRKFEEPYLSEQVYINPHPVELTLRNHV